MALDVSRTEIMGLKTVKKSHFISNIGMLTEIQLLIMVAVLVIASTLVHEGIYSTSCPFYATKRKSNDYC